MIVWAMREGRFSTRHAQLGISPKRDGGQVRLALIALIGLGLIEVGVGDGQGNRTALSAGGNSSSAAAGIGARALCPALPLVESVTVSPCM